MAVSFTLNATEVNLEVDPDMPLLWVLRDILGLTGTKYGCGIGACGACMVHVDGEATPSCVTAVDVVAGKRITTIEGLSTRSGRAVQTAWRNLDVVQCGYCQSGQIMAASALLATKPKPTDADIDQAMSINLCRCATYHRIRAAVHEAAKLMEP